MEEEMKGAWMNKRTGQTITVRDSIIQANNKGEDEMVMVTSIGIIPLNTFSQLYIKVSEEDYGQQGVAPEVSGENLTETINKGLDEDLQIKQENILQNSILDMPITSAPVTEAPKNMNYALIEKVMNKYQNAITMTFEANPDEWPKAELQMLINTFDVNAEEICDYIIDKYLNKKSLLEPFKAYLMAVLDIDK